MNNAINEIKNTLEETKSRIMEAEDRISELEDRMVEINESERIKCLENPHGQRSQLGYSPWGCSFRPPPLASGTGAWGSSSQPPPLTSSQPGDKD